MKPWPDPNNARQTLHVIMNQQLLDASRLPGKTVVVFDVLLATTTIAMVLHLGASEVITTPEVEAARQLQFELNDLETVLAGEKDAKVPDGFESFQPSKLRQLSWHNKRLVLVTTNGTVALHNSRSADHVYSCALVNVRATARAILDQQHTGTVLLVCAGSKHRFNVEDFIGAGMLARELTRMAPDRFGLTDTAQAAVCLADTGRHDQIISDCRVGRLLTYFDMVEDVDIATDANSMPVVARWNDGVLKRTS